MTCADVIRAPLEKDISKVLQVHLQALTEYYRENFAGLWLPDNADDFVSFLAVSKKHRRGSATMLAELNMSVCTGVSGEKIS